VPGVLTGHPIELMPWQKREILRIYDNPAGPTRRAISSVGRKSGKTTLAACLLLVHLAGSAAIAALGECPGVLLSVRSPILRT
jgi:phage terminase large subunit-like protein